MVPMAAGNGQGGQRGALCPVESQSQCQDFGTTSHSGELSVPVLSQERETTRTGTTRDELAHLLPQWELIGQWEQWVMVVSTLETTVMVPLFRHIQKV